MRPHIPGKGAGREERALMHSSLVTSQIGSNEGLTERNL